MEIMLNSLLKGLGLDATQIGGLAEKLTSGLDTMLESNAKILRNQRRIMRSLNIPLGDTDDDDGDSDRAGSDAGTGDPAAGG